MLVTIKRAAEELGLSPKTLYGLTQKKAIPFHKIGGALRFDVEEIKKATRREVAIHRRKQR